MRAGIRNPDGELVAIPRALRAFPRRGHSRMPAAKACLVGPAVRPWLSRGESARAGRALDGDSSLWVYLDLIAPLVRLCLPACAFSRSLTKEC